MSDVKIGRFEELVVSRRQLQEEVDALRTRLAEVEAKLHLQETTQDPQPTLADFQQSQADLVSLGKKLEQVEADAAVMREALEMIADQSTHTWSQKFAQSALSTNAGKSLLERLQEAEKLLRVPYDG